MSKKRRKPYTTPIDFDPGIPGAFAVRPETVYTRREMDAHKRYEGASPAERREALNDDSRARQRARHREKSSLTLVDGGRSGRCARIVREKGANGEKRGYVARVHPLTKHERSRKFAER